MLPLWIEYEYDGLPWATIGIMLTCVLVFLAQAEASEASQRAFMLQPDRLAPWQWVTSVFMHGSVGHLLGNMLFLFVYGRYMEQRLGPWRYLALYIALGIGASLVFLFTNLGSAIPALGASGAISGLMGAVMLTTPHAKVRVIWGWYYIFMLPAAVLLAIWFAGQVLMAIVGMPGVAISAHIGGFLLGMAAAAFLRHERLRDTGWYLDPDRATVDSASLRREEHIWKAIADHHNDKGRRPPEATPSRHGR